MISELKMRSPLFIVLAFTMFSFLWFLSGIGCIARNDYYYSKNSGVFLTINPNAAQIAMFSNPTIAKFVLSGIVAVSIIFLSGIFIMSFLFSRSKNENVRRIANFFVLLDFSLWAVFCNIAVFAFLKVFFYTKIIRVVLDVKSNPMHNNSFSLEAGFFVMEMFFIFLPLLYFFRKFIDRYFLVKNQI